MHAQYAPPDCVDALIKRFLIISHDISFVGCGRWGSVMQVMASDLCKPFCPIWPAVHHRTLNLPVSVSTSVHVYCLSLFKLIHKPNRWHDWSLTPPIK